MLSKCCFCFDLEMGYLTFSIIALAFKFCCVTFLHYTITLDILPISKDYYMTKYAIMGIGFVFGYVVFTVLCLFLTLKGIMKKRSILMFPYTVVLFSETVLTALGLLFALITAPLVGVPGFFGLLINIYIISLHVALCERYKMGEKRAAMNNSIENAQLLESFTYQ